MALLGSLIIVLHAPPDQDIETVDEILVYAIKPGQYQADEQKSNVTRTHQALSRLPSLLRHRRRLLLRDDI